MNSYTPDELRKLAKEQKSPFFNGQAAEALVFAADVIDAANDVIAEHQAASQARQEPTVEQVEAEVGIGSAAWDMVDPPEKLIQAVLKLARQEPAKLDGGRDE